MFVAASAAFRYIIPRGLPIVWWHAIVRVRTRRDLWELKRISRVQTNRLSKDSCGSYVLCGAILWKLHQKIPEGQVTKRHYLVGDSPGRQHSKPNEKMESLTYFKECQEDFDYTVHHMIWELSPMKDYESFNSGCTSVLNWYHLYVSQRTFCLGLQQNQTFLQILSMPWHKQPWNARERNRRPQFLWKSLWNLQMRTS